MNILHVENSSGRGGSLRSLRELWPAPKPWSSFALSLERSWGEDVSLDIPVFRIGNQSVAKILRLIQEKKIDVIHINNSPIEAWSAVVAAWWEGIPVVSHMRSARTLRKLEKILMSQIEVLWVLSSVHKNILSKHHKVKILRNGIEDPGQAPFQEKPVIGIFSVLKEGKGHEDILKALAEIEEPWCLRIVGGPVTDQPSTLPQLKELALKLGINERVEFTGHVPNAIEEMKKCFLIVDPSKKKEGFRRTLGEAAFLDRHLLATSVGGASDLLSENHLIEPGNISEWTRALKEMIGRKENWSEGSTYRQKALELFEKKASSETFWKEISGLVEARL